MPTGAEIESTSQQQKVARVRIYPGADADFTLYSDDGTTYAYEKGDFRITKLHWDDAAKKLSHEGAEAWSEPDSEIVEIAHKLNLRIIKQQQNSQGAEQ